MAFSPARTALGVTCLPVISTSATGSINTVSCALLLAALGSPSAVLVTVAVLVKLPSCSGRVSVTSTVTVWPGARVPALWEQVSRPAADTAQLKAALPAETTGVITPTPVRPTMKPALARLSEITTPDAASLPALTLLTTSR